MIWKKLYFLIAIFKNIWLSLSQAQFSDDARSCSNEECIRVYDSWHISPTGLGDDYWITCCICITISHVTLIKIMLCYVMLCYVMQHSYAMLCYVMLCYVMLCYVMLCYVMLCYVMLCYVMLCYVMLCYVMLCYVMLCYVMLCYVMLCYVMLCYVMLCMVKQYASSSVIPTMAKDPEPHCHMLAGQWQRNTRTVFYLWLSKVSVNERIRYTFYVFSHWFRP